LKRKNALQAVRSAFVCEQQQTTTANIKNLEATGKCKIGSVRSGKTLLSSASCGHSYEYDEQSSQCRQTLFDRLVTSNSSPNDLLATDDEEELS
jgi:hypothetical protein